jgi:ABC-type multidrug transport system ATPase subunit
MALLELDHVTQRYGHGSAEHVVLADVSLDLYPGEMVAISGKRGSGRSTLLRLAAGLEAPSAGVVRFRDNDLKDRRRRDLGAGIGLCRRTFRGKEGLVVKDHLVVGQLARGVSPELAGKRAWWALERVGASDCAAHPAGELDTAELVRVMIARALVFGPELLVIDDPVMGVDLLERDSVLDLLRSLADDGVAVLQCVGNASAFRGCHRTLHLGEGRLRGDDPTPELAAVVNIDTQRQASA